MSELILERVEINSFAGIDRSKPVILDLGKKQRKGQTVTKFSGDQGLGKTSTMTALLYLLGIQVGVDFSELINDTDKTINAEQEFTLDGVLYRVKATKSKFSLERDVDGKWYAEDEPKTTLKKLIGNIGVSPMFLKGKDGAKQIEWFQQTFDADEATVKKEAKLRAGIATAKATRRDANRDYSRLKNALAENELWKNAEENYQRFAQPVSAEEAEARFNEQTERMKEYDKAHIGLIAINNEIDSLNAEIDRLQAKLKQAVEMKDAAIVRKRKGEEWIAEHATVKLDYDDAKKAYMEVSKTIAEQQAWEVVLRQKKEMDDFETIVQQADSKRDELAADLQKLTKKYLPDVEGLEIKIAKGLKDDEPEGIFYQGKSLAKLSESELWGLFFQIWEKKDVQIVFIDNVQNLGTDAVATLNEFVRKGVKVFATAMKRQLPTMKITISDKVD